MGYSHLVFDIDGTLLNTEYAILHALSDTLAAVTGKGPAPEELTFVLGIPGEDALTRLGIPDIPATLTLWVENMAPYAGGIDLFPGVQGVLTALRERGTALGIVTSQTRAEFEGDLGRREIGGWFQTVICAEDAAAHKPHPAPLLRYLERTGAPRGEVLYVGDSVYDSRCAHAAGVDFALALWGAHDPEIPAQHRLAAPEAILPLL